MRGRVTFKTRPTSSVRLGRDHDFVLTSALLVLLPVMAPPCGLPDTVCPIGGLEWPMFAATHEDFHRGWLPRYCTTMFLCDLNKGEYLVDAPLDQEDALRVA